MASILNEYRNLPVFEYCQKIESAGNSVNFEPFFFEGHDDPILHFGWIIAVSKLSNKNLIVVCSDHAFKALRTQGNTLLVYKQRETIDPENSFVVGVAGFSIYHYINPDLRNDLIWSSTELLNPLTDEDIMSVNLPRVRLSPININDDSSDNVFDEVVEADNGNNENDSNVDVVGIEVENAAASDDTDVTDVTEPTEISIQSACTNIGSISAEMFLSCNQRINFDSERVDDTSAVQMGQTFDIDGVFIILTVDDMKSKLKTPITLSKNPKRADVRNVKNFVKNFSRTTITIPSHLELFRLGYIGAEFGKFDVYFYHGLDSINATDEDQRRLSTTDRCKLFRDCLDYSKLFRCDTCSEHGPICTTKQYRSQRESHHPISGVAEDLIPIPLLGCFFHHYEVKLNRTLLIENVISGFYLRAIGTKNSLVTNNAESFYQNMEKISSIIDINNLPLDSVAFDFCIQTVYHGGRSVKFHYELYFINNFLVFFIILES